MHAGRKFFTRAGRKAVNGTLRDIASLNVPFTDFERAWVAGPQQFGVTPSKEAQSSWFQGSFCHCSGVNDRELSPATNVHGPT
jgi:hypothetical protein